MRVVFHRLLKTDIKAALAYYEAVGGSALARRFGTELEDAVEAVLKSPRKFARAANDLRRVRLSSFPYHLLFEEKEDSLRFLVLRHDKRHPAYGLSRQ